LSIQTPALKAHFKMTPHSHSKVCSACSKAPIRRNNKSGNRRACLQRAKSRQQAQIAKKRQIDTVDCAQDARDDTEAAPKKVHIANNEPAHISLLLPSSHEAIAKACGIDSEDHIAMECIQKMLETFSLDPVAIRDTKTNQDYYFLSARKEIERFVSRGELAVACIPLQRDANLPQQNIQGHTRNSCIKYVIQQSPYSIFKQLDLVEMNEDLIALINNDWQKHNDMHYAISQLFAGAILLNGMNALYLTTVEVYCRFQPVDAHYEHYLSGVGKPPLETSLPTMGTRYDGITVARVNEDNSTHLKIGAASMNILVVGSVMISSANPAEVGPSTNHFSPSHQTQIYLDARSVQVAKKAFQHGGPSSKDIPLANLRQVRSKYSAESTFLSARATCRLLGGLPFQPVTVWTFANFDNGSQYFSDTKIASQIFQKVAIAAHKDNRLFKHAIEKVLRLRSNNAKKTKLNDHCEQVLHLFGQEDHIDVVSNHNLSKKLTQMASMIAPRLTQSNKKIAAEITKHLSRYMS
jgi:hypothetical protein